MGVEGSVPTQMLTLDDLLLLEGPPRPLSGSLSVTVIGDKRRYGERIEVRGQIQRYRSSDPRRLGYLRTPHILKVTPASPSFQGYLESLKHFFEERLANFLPDPAGGFAAGLLLGSKSALPKDVVEDFKKTGLMHTVAVSGFNMVIIISTITALFSHFRLRTSVVLSLLFIFIFTLLVGASASVVRAALMASLSLSAQIFGRHSASLRTLAIAGYCMIIADPFILLHDIGFQLSFGATLGIILYTKRINERLSFLPSWYSLRETFATTLGAHIFTLPLTMFYFKSISLVAPISNIIILPTLPLLMLGSLLTLIGGKILAAPTWIFFKIVLFTIHLLAQAPFSFVEFGT